MKTLAACLLSLVLLPACASTGDYFLNRGGDLVDCARVHVMAGKGIGLKVDFTRAVQGGILWEDECWAAGLANRELAHWRESIFSWGIVFGYHNEKSITGLDGNRYTGSYGWTFGEKGGNVFDIGDKNNWLDLLTYRVAVMVGVGFDVELRVGEMLDFLCGIFQFDPSGDDHAYSTMKKAQ